MNRLLLLAVLLLLAGCEHDRVIATTHPADWKLIHRAPNGEEIQWYESGQTPIYEESGGVPTWKVKDWNNADRVVIITLFDGSITIKEL